jgi:GTP-binding protein
MCDGLQPVGEGKGNHHPVRSSLCRSKCTSVVYKGNKVNIVDTPGHHDFGGEVERIMSMVDGVCLLICATEGPMAQSKFVLRKALENKLKPIVIINKVDRPTARLKEVENEVFELFCDLNCPDELLSYPIYYASGKHGWAVKNMEDEKTNVNCILDCILNDIPAPKVSAASEFSLLVSQTEPNSFFGKMCLGRINSGNLEIGKKLNSYDQEGNHVETSKVTKIIRRLGLNQIEMLKAVSGDIVSIAGFQNTGVTHTLCEDGYKSVVKSNKIDPPMMAISINVNTSPLAGREGDKFTLNEIKARLLRESENDVALVIDGAKGKSNSVTVRGRGDLHLGILLEKMRR